MKTVHTKSNQIVKTVKASVTSLALLSLGLVAGTRADQQVSAGFPMPVRVEADVSTFDCENSPGPRIEFEGVMTFGGFSVDLIFRNNINKDVHVHTEEVVVNTVLIPAGEKIVIRKQPVLGGVGGNPFIWVQFLNASGEAESGEIFLGRCVQGAFKIDATPDTWVDALVNVAVKDCSNNPGPHITLDGAMMFSEGLQVQFIFRNNDNPVGGPHEANVSRPVALIPDSTHVQFPKQPVLGGVGGNPWISVQFRDGDGTTIGDEVLLGRCVQLSQQ